ncbi:shikimate dehydrogenase [candidate division WOR-1 bacterium RIFOXYD2_FULL_36_8]|uniref:Shikimate dehydrogenase (NADP(+)) n=1 Tax=candidate division WOR-1 bacterium RIFOXYB2_FULL_36_35 TaxID=1802578 RepID=A0A1F4S2F0_UNCSA|nr:MAG: shikimate dehydrogenase [candidate division WOR-1 bacterium RIFOXYA2_FULL_36_21]OGC14636.1 MAG: shikimate dehydrogenase [candidate division WOR-1 bacterium RIFOXYB2_FULL_36_35]OGC19654.1 MAG: shikimate dehydrogenase [candidate division WOR-1 bacterium RIFOXYA12_FULL_36_13]OGC41384.1 MAG: shikimate dehydrogenase [candidate division WOR-1 bacterium RIFOXYD2_FULL_36_8]
MKKTGLIGYPLGHSISPAMHNAAFKALGIDAEYSLYEVRPEELGDEVDDFRGNDYLGFNVTVPYKCDLMRYVDDVTKLADLIGAINTVVNRDDKLIGYNTDGPAFIQSLNEDGNFDPKDKIAVVLGAGGAGRAVSVMLAESKAKKIIISDVISEKAEELAGYINAELHCKCKFIPIDGIGGIIKEAQLLVNSSPIGMYPKVEEIPLPYDCELHSHLVVYDLVYNPRESRLLKKAKEAGAKAISGLGMLVRQGALAFSIFTDEEPPIEIMWEAAEKALINR